MHSVDPEVKQSYDPVLGEKRPVYPAIFPDLAPTNDHLISFNII
jgi:hypothetical protein